MDSKKKAKPGEEDERTSFTIETDTSKTVEVPSIGRLLNRKSLKTSLISRPKALPEVSRILPSARASKLISAPQVDALRIWEKNLLSKNSDPLSKVILFLLEHGATAAVLLVELETLENTWGAKIALGSSLRLALWKGLSWQPSSVIDLWQRLKEETAVELSPPASTTTFKSNRSVARKAFGVEAQESLSLLWLGGSREKPSAILAVISNESLSLSVQSIFSLLSSIEKEHLPK